MTAEDPHIVFTWFRDYMKIFAKYPCQSRNRKHVQPKIMEQ